MLCILSLVLKIFEIFSYFFGDGKNDLFKKISLILILITTMKTNNCNTHIAQYIEK